MEDERSAGIKAIMGLQAAAGIEVAEELAAESWDKMTPWMRGYTLHMWRLVSNPIKNNCN